MAILIRHGGESHVMRPDGVMRTSVIRPFVGYNPQADVQSVARAFTTGGPLATTLSGFGAPGQGAIATWWENLKAKIANRKMEKAAVKEAVRAAITNNSPGTEQSMASQVAPQMQGQMQMLKYLTQGSNAGHVRGPLARAMSTLAARRPITFYRAG